MRDLLWTNEFSYFSFFFFSFLIVTCLMMEKAVNRKSRNGEKCQRLISFFFLLLKCVSMAISSQSLVSQHDHHRRHYSGVYKKKSHRARAWEKCWNIESHKSERKNPFPGFSNSHIYIMMFKGIFPFRHVTITVQFQYRRAGKGKYS